MRVEMFRLIDGNFIISTVEVEEINSESVSLTDPRILKLFPIPNTDELGIAFEPLNPFGSRQEILRIKRDHILFDVECPSELRNKYLEDSTGLHLPPSAPPPPDLKIS